MESLTQNTEARRFVFAIDEVRPLIAWPYFFWAWGLAHADDEEKQKLRTEADAMLDSWSGRLWAKALVCRLSANSDSDDIILADGAWRLPLLRQQEEPFLCLADYIRPAEQGIKDELNVFCTTTDVDVNAYEDDFARMLAQTLADRIAEATAEKISEGMTGIRPAVGYPSLPDMSINFILNEILHMEQIGITLTESGMMRPHASVSGLMIAHPLAQYFNINRIGDDQLADYARRKGVSIEEVKRFIKQ